MRSTRMATVAISLASILPMLYLGVASGDFKKGISGEMIVAILVFFSPSIVLACLGYRPTNSKSLPNILLGSSVVSTGLWMLVALQFMGAAVVDAQSGLVVVLVLPIQLLIVVVATISFLLLRKRDG